jgi:hypothetical protein
MKKKSLFTPEKNFKLKNWLGIDRDQHSSKSLDPDPHMPVMNADPKHWPAWD